MIPNPTDTQEKIVYKDHDILIALHTNMEGLIKRHDDDGRAAADRNQQIALELKTISVEQARISTEITNFKQDKAELERRMERLEAKSNIWDLVNSFGVLVSAGIGFI